MDKEFVELLDKVGFAADQRQMATGGEAYPLPKITGAALDRLGSEMSRELVHVFTNGCFSLIHAGHVDLLNKAKMIGNFLTVAINSDESYIHLKGRLPIFTMEHRKLILSSLKCVDRVIVFDDISVYSTIKKLVEQGEIDYLVKGGDYKDHTQVVGWDIVGKEKVRIIPITYSISTTEIVNHLKAGGCAWNP